MCPMTSSPWTTCRGAHRGQIDGTPEDGDSLYDVVDE